MQIPERFGDGYLVDMNAWSPEIAQAMAQADDVELDEEQWEQLKKAHGTTKNIVWLPPIRKFAKQIEVNQKDMFKKWTSGSMKSITKYGGLPKPTGCV